MNDEPLSPELVLVAPPDLAAYARRSLSENPFAFAVQDLAEMSTPLGRGFALFALVCVAATVGPFALALLARAH
jgi:hypothetical protein